MYDGQRTRGNAAGFDSQQKWEEDDRTDAGALGSATAPAAQYSVYDGPPHAVSSSSHQHQSQQHIQHAPIVTNEPCYINHQYLNTTGPPPHAQAHVWQSEGDATDAYRGQMQPSALYAGSDHIIQSPSLASGALAILDVSFDTGSREGGRDRIGDPMSGPSGGPSLQFKQGSKRLRQSATKSSYPPYRYPNSSSNYPAAPHVARQGAYPFAFGDPNQSHPPATTMMPGSQHGLMGQPWPDAALNMPRVEPAYMDYTMMGLDPNYGQGLPATQPSGSAPLHSEGPSSIARPHSVSGSTDRSWTSPSYAHPRLHSDKRKASFASRDDMSEHDDEGDESMISKLDKRRGQNKVAQRAFRARGKVQAAEVNAQIAGLTELTESQRIRLEESTALVASLQKENQALKLANAKARLAASDPSLETRPTPEVLQFRLPTAEADPPNSQVKKHEKDPAEAVDTPESGGTSTL